jgi:hypothetical protein
LNATPAAAAPVAPRGRLTPRLGWFKLQRADLARIRELGEVDGVSISTPVLIAVWAAFCDVANEKRSPTFEIAVGIIRKRAGVSRRTAFEAIKVLEFHLKMLTHTARKSENLTHFDTNIWTIFPAIEKTSAANALGNQRTTPSAEEVPQNSHKSVKNTEKESCASAAGPAAASAPQSAASQKGEVDKW